MSNSEEKKKMSAWKVFLIFLVLLALIAGGGYYALNQYFSGINKFPDGTKINGVDVSGQTVSYAEELLTDAWNQRTLAVTNQGSTIGSISNFNFSYDIDAQVESCLQPEFFEALIRLVHPTERDYSIHMKVVETSKSFDDQFAALSIVKDAKPETKTENAYVDLSTTDFEVIPEVYGDTLDKDALKEALIDAIADGKEAFEYVPSRYYLQPEIKADSPEIQAELDYANKYLSTEIAYVTPGNGEYILTPKQLNKMIKVKDDGTIKVRKKAVTAFMDTLAMECNTVGDDRELKMPGGNITVGGGTYGYAVDKEGEAKQLTKDLKSGENVKRKPIYSQEGWGDGSDDIGDTYVEASIGQQHVWCVVDGKTVVSSDFVSGDVTTGNGTPTGIYPLMYKTSPATLEGENNDGSKYKTPVTYWMPFYAGCGFHDATWRSAFGGQIYRGNGSHGCLNMPYSQAQKLYRYVEAGMPIIVHE